ncbi:MAG: pilus assembly protein PilM [Lachnospiraceae bacterium]|nr:pilus assembly protein PilM [Lachnospiraceae bacterium]
MAAKILTIEIGNDFIKICEAQQLKGKTVTVHNAVSIQTPENAVEDGIIRDMEGVAAAIRNAMTDEQIVASSVTFILSSARVASKEVILPIIKKEKIQEMINVNASEYFPINIDDYVLSYTVLETKNTKEEKKTRVLVYAAPEHMVKGYYQLAELLKMKVTAVDFVGNSTMQLVKTQIDDRPTLVIQMGMDATIVSVMNKKVLQLQRTVPYGESLLLNAVMEEKKVSAKVAMELLGQAKLVKAKIDEDKTTESLKYLVSNVNRVVEYYTGRNAEAPLQKAVIIGDGAEVLGLDELFTNELSLTTERITLLKNVESYNRIKLSTSLLKLYMANIGATLSPINFQLKEQNASKEKAAGKKQANSAIYYIVGLVGIIAAIGLYAIPAFMYLQKEAEKEQIEKDIEEIKGIEATMNEYYASEDRLLDLQAFVLTTENDNEWTLEFIKTLEEKMPAKMEITNLSATDGVVSIMGACASKDDVADLVVSLKSVKNIIDVQCKVVTETKDNPEKGTKSGVSFDMQCTYVNDVDKLAEQETAEQTTAAQAE